MSSPWFQINIVSKPDEHPRIGAVGALVGYILPALYADRAPIPIIERELVQYPPHGYAVPRRADHQARAEVSRNMASPKAQHVPWL